MLKFCAIYLNDRAGIAKENFRSRFYNARFARSGGAQEQEVTDRPPRRVQSGAKDLIQVHQSLNSFFLSNDLGSHGPVELSRLIAADCGIQLPSGGGTHLQSPSFNSPRGS